MLRCVCGAVVEGSDAELLEAVERHLREDHVGGEGAVREAHATGEAGVTEASDEGGQDA